MKKLLSLLICVTLLLSVAGCTTVSQIELSGKTQGSTSAQTTTVTLQPINGNLIYVCSEWIYDGTVGNIRLTTDEMMPLSIAENKLYGYDRDGTAELIGELVSATLTAEQFDQLFSDYGYRTDVKARQLREENQEAWWIDLKDSDSKQLMCLLKQKNGDLYMAEGRIHETSQRFYWCYRLEPASDNVVSVNKVHPQSLLTEAFFEQSEGVEKSLLFSELPNSLADIDLLGSGYSVTIYDDRTLIIGEPFYIYSSVLQIVKRLPFTVEGDDLVAHDGDVLHVLQMCDGGFLYYKYSTSSEQQNPEGIFLKYRSSDTKSVSE